MPRKPSVRAIQRARASSGMWPDQAGPGTGTLVSTEGMARGCRLLYCDALYFIRERRMHWSAWPWTLHTAVPNAAFPIHTFIPNSVFSKMASLRMQSASASGRAVAIPSRAIRVQPRSRVNTVTVKAVGDYQV